MHLYYACNSEAKIHLTDEVTGAGSTNGCAIIIITVQGMFTTNYQAARLVFATNNTNILTISALKRVVVGGNNTYNILQVGDCRRLRISNGSGDYTALGTSDVLDDNKNKIRSNNQYYL